MGTKFVTDHEPAKLFKSYGSTSVMESIALKATMALPALLLQKPHRQSRSCDLTSSVLNVTYNSGCRVTMMFCSMKTMLSWGICTYSTITSIDSSCVHACCFFMARLKQPSDFSWSNFMVPFCHILCQWVGLLCWRNLSRNIQIHLQSSPDLR